MDQPGPSSSNQDPRFDFIGSYVVKSLKLKPEKWMRVLTIEEHRSTMRDFVDKPNNLLLVIILTHAAQLVPVLSFPCYLKNKAVYFVKKRADIVPKERCAEMVIFGDLAPRIIDELASLVDEVFVPLLSNPLNHEGWPRVVSKDILKQIHNLKSTVYEVKGKVNGQTVLPLPVGVEFVHEAEKEVLKGKEVDLYLKSAIEGVVIKWAQQINDVMMEDSAQAFDNGQNPLPNVELAFWRSRLSNLNYIYDQLRNERVRCMAVILEKTNSAYYPCFSRLFKNIVSALAEAREIDFYLRTLEKHFQALEDTDFTECQPLFRPLFHVICMVWRDSKYYCSSSKLMVLIRQISNLIIYQAKKCLDPSTLFHSDIDEAKQRIQLTIDILKNFRHTFENFKENLAKYFENRTVIPWTFHPNVVFERMNKFLDRLNTIQWFFKTVIEFQKLEKIEIGGMKGRVLGGQIREISAEFESYFHSFASKSYDVLDPDDETFNEDFKKFQDSIIDLDLKLSTVLVESFDNCSTLEAIFKLIDIVGSVLERPLIKNEFTAKYVEIIELFNEQSHRQEKYGHMEIDAFFPPVAGGLLYMTMLAARISKPVASFRSLPHPIKDCEDAQRLFSRYEKLIERINDFKKKYFDDWAKTIPKFIEEKTNNPIITRQGADLILNFSPALIDVMKEVDHLRENSEIQKGLPQDCLALFEKRETYRQYRINLGITIDWYNQIHRNSQKVEFDLVEDEIKAIDQRIELAQRGLNWNSKDLWSYLEELHKLVGNLYDRMSKIQDNLKEIKSIMKAWSSQPLFERKEGKKDTLMNLDDRKERTSKRYNDIKETAERIRTLLDENMELFNMQDNQNSEKWLAYVAFIDKLIEEELFKSIACSLGYISEHMNPKNKLSPLFEAQLELLEPDMVFSPTLDINDEKGFTALINNLIEDILRMSTFIDRIDLKETISYYEQIKNHNDIMDMKEDVLNGIERVIEEANDFCKTFENYSFLWLEERDAIMEIFLEYGRILTPDEIDKIGSEDKDVQPPEPCPPKMEAFREQIDHYENLFMEIEDMQSYKVFNSWFQVDIRPFRQALLNLSRKWGNMYKEHLVENVTSNLSDLGNFIREADEGLLQPVPEGDYEALVTVMGYLMNVKDRTLTTDDMFQPLTETIELLKFYDMDIPEEVNVLLQELPEQWQATKKLALTVKQQVAPLQAAEVSCIRKKITAFDSHVTYYREVFKKYDFFKYECDDPYEVMSRVDMEMLHLEDDMKNIQDSGSLFEVNVPEFKLLKQCRKELRMLKQLWDYVYIVRTSIEDWKTTPWRKIDVENMDIECKKFAKEIRLLDKEMRRIVMDANTTLADLLALNLHEFEEEVKNIVDKAVKEMSMEKILKDLNTTWSHMEFEQEFIAHFLEEVSTWQQKLSIADQVITVWFEVQRTWTHLESIFMSSEDIRKQLPEDSARFDRVDAEFKILSSDMSKTPNVVKGTNKEGLVSTLDGLQKDLIMCEKALAEYLETKRLAFPRFYFVSSADLLDILSNAKLRFGENDKPEEKMAAGMIAKDGEYVPFHGICDCSGAVEIWLNRLQDIMRSSIRQYFSEAIVTYEEKPREQWLFDYMAQVSLCCSQIWWTTEVNLAFGRLEEGYDNALKDYYKKQLSQLSTLITLLIGELTKQDRQKIMTICTIDVHSRDVVGKLIQGKVEAGSAFQWQSQLRHRWDDKETHCFANICDAQFKYSYEYLGNTPRLVITPLTDRCYITLTQSLHLVMGGGPAGPAGTGKTETTKDLGRALGIMVYVFNCSEQMDYQSCGNIYKGLAQTGAWGCFDEFNRISVEVLSVVAVQVKSVQDAIRDKKEKFNFMGEIIVLEPSVGIFITMNPGYAGRTELPENLKALFRPCAMVVPDFELICEIMLVAEGFQEAKILARKFITLYTLCKELLSKQDHYDWGLRAIKSVLVVAGSLKRGDPGRPEEEVLMRTLRDFNIPKIITDDMPVFMGLIGDLFPALEVPRKRDLEFERTVKQAAMDLLLQPEDNFILKVVQLEELLEVRHSVFIVGNAGTGKTQVWKTLFKTYQNLKKKPIFNDLNPKAVTNDELFGIINPATREWKDGLFSVIMRDQANIAGENPKWIVLDGDIDPMWIESLNTVMDDNKILTLASNERIALTPSMRLMFEISNLRTATPATVSRAGILYINPQDLGWNPYVTSWIETRKIPSEKSNLVILFDKYIPPCLETVRNRFKKITPIADMAHIQMLCHLLNCLLVQENTPPDCPKEWHDIFFVFACVWAFGSAMFQETNVDYRVEFSKWWVNEFKNIKFPAGGTVFDYYIDSETKQFTPWTEKITKFELDSDVPLQAVLVPTAETIRVRYFLDLLMKNKHPVMLVGGAGCGKTVLVNEKLQSLPESYAIQSIPFNFYTTSEMLQKILEKPLEKKAGRNYGPPGNKTLIYFIDDMNMPEVDSYGTVQPHTIIRQHLDYNHWYDRTKLTLKDIHNTQYVSCMNPTSGSFTINPRLQRHFCVFAISFPNTEALNNIYLSILSQHLTNPELRIGALIAKLSTNVVSATVALHNKVAQGFLFSTNECLVNPSDLIRLWLHETHRVYGDKISRILESPRGSALLVGVGGSGKQSLSRLAAFIASLEVSQIQLKKGYGVSDLKHELSGLYIKTGLKNVGIMFLMTDAQVANEQFLVLINDLLASGEVGDLFPDDEIENIIAGVRNEVKGAGLPDTREICWKFFIDRVRKQLKVVLCFSPVGSTLRVRSRKFPALINCTSINWFHEWPQEALVSVSMRFLEELLVLPIPLRDSVSRFMAYVHTSVNTISKAYLANERRYNYTTPKSYLEQISLYSKLVNLKADELRAKISRLENGLEKLRSTASQVDALKVKLAIQEIELQQKNEAADKLIEMVGVETAKVQSEKALADEEEEKVAVIAEEVSKKQKDCEEDLIKAEPALVAAQEALNTLNKANLTELKSFGSPPGAVTNVTAAVMVLLAPGGKIPKDRSWKSAKMVMAKVDVFLEALIHYDKENIHPDVIKAIQPYLKDSEFEPEFVRSKSAAAAGLCAWVINIIKFFEVFCDVEPKRKALAAANAELAAATEKLKSIKSKVASLEEQLATLTADFEKATLEKLKCQQEADATNRTIQLANRLVNGLASENVRWAEAVSNFMQQSTTLPGDVLLVCAFISYVGCFTKLYRLDLLQKNWLPFLKTLEPPIPITEGLDPLTMLTDDTTIAIWQNEGLPSDRMSTENATILSNSDRWPLMIDPQLQGVKWIKQKYGDMLRVIRLGQKGYLDTIEKAIIKGETVLLENIGETVDPVLDPLLGRNLMKKGRAIKIGDKEIEYSSNFRLILHTKLANPHYKPEMQAQTTLVNFTVTRDGLEDQLLAEVVKAERPDLEELKAELTKQQNEFKIQLKKLEDNLLSRLSSAGENILGDTALIENLEITKKTAADIEKKVTEAKVTSHQIDQAREFYRPAAARASLLYFILNDLNTINPIYQFSLKAFSVVFQKAICKAEPADEVAQRIRNLIDCITYSVFQYTSRGLFECDKLIFASQMTFQILLMSEEVSPVELDFFLRFPVKPHVTSPVDFLSNQSWGGICSLASKDEFRNLDRDIETSPKRWKKIVEMECPEREKFPQEWKNKTALQRLCMLRALRPDRMTYAVATYIEEKMGTKYVENRTMEFSKSFEETSPTTPIFFILSPGVNPLKDVEALGKAMGFNTDKGNFHNVSLGQGQENIHLVKKWLPSLEKKMESYAHGYHEEYRLFMSAEPAATAAAHIIPQGILESSIKITNEPPTGMQTLEMCGKEAEFKAILFSLCYFHAVVAERRKFGPQGWNKIYPFNVGDLTISVFVLYNYLEANSKVPWEDLRYLFGFPAPPNTDYAGYHQYIEDAMPAESPYLYGLHPNAEIGFLTTTSENLFRTIFEMQPRDAQASGATTVKQMLDEIAEKLPEEFNMVEIMGKVEERTPYVIVAFQECERMNHLTGEMKRSLRELDLGLKGELTITSDMEELENALFLDQVPAIWANRAYPSLLGLSAWFVDLLLRLRELETWATDFVSLLTAIMQSTARRYELPLDKMCLQCDVTKKMKEEFTILIYLRKHKTKKRIKKQFNCWTYKNYILNIIQVNLIRINLALSK
ncbi:unnamed protein product, partial [Leptidea sinapis]